MGFYYLNDRYYDSITGRFLTPDDPSYLVANGDLLSYNLYVINEFGDIIINYIVDLFD